MAGTNNKMPPVKYSNVLPYILIMFLSMYIVIWTLDSTTYDVHHHHHHFARSATTIPPSPSKKTDINLSTRHSGPATPPRPTNNQCTEPRDNCTTNGNMKSPPFILRTLNRTVIINLQNKVRKKLQPWQVIQIFRANVDPEHMQYKRHYKDINNTEELRVTDEILERRNSCALVGNSGILLNSRCGDVIDDTDIVIRMNLANFAHEYSSDVGSRTSFMTINGEQTRLVSTCFNKMVKTNSTKVPYENRTESVVNLPPKCAKLIERLRLLKKDNVLWPSRGYLWRLADVLPVLRDRFHLDFRIGYNPANLQTVARRLWGFEKPSSGLSLFSASVHLCEEVSLFGFYPFYRDEYNRTIPHHYYEPEVEMNYTTNAHKIPQEYELFLDLENLGGIRIINNCTFL